MLNYLSIFKRSFLQILKNRLLWVSGIFASFLALNFSVYSSINLSYQDGFFYTLYRILAEKNFFSYRTFSNFIVLFSENPVYFAVIITIFLLALIIAVGVAALGVLSQSALIFAGDLDDTFYFFDGILRGINRFWSLLFLNFFIKLLILMLVVYPGYLALGAEGGLMYVYGSFFVVFSVLVLFFSFITRYSMYHVVIDDLTFAGALKKGWSDFFANWYSTLEVAFFLFAAEVVMVLAVKVIALLTVFLTPFLIYFLGLFLSGTALSSVSFFLLSFLTGVLVFLIFSSFFISLSWLVWTKFIALTQKGKFSLLKSLLKF
ncbi:hypothetical protein C4572_03920 [Candidatus Parcubacteria bacterium]|nr:MAG: hypothetical protein C4572_03920 [Candidatus Parcubacteria bacterium]